MPNHVTNFVKAPVYILKALLDDMGRVDFHKVIPNTLPYPNVICSNNSFEIPKALEALKEMNLEQRKQFYKTLTSNNPWFNDFDNNKKISAIEVFEQTFQNMLITGYPTWYEWNVDNFGTKWNAYSAMANLDDNDPFVVFQTAWSMPHEVFVKLSEKFPGTMISVAFADENFGSNFGIMGYVEGTWCPLEPHIFLGEKLTIIKSVFDFCIGLSKLNHPLLNYNFGDMETNLDICINHQKNKGYYFMETWEEAKSSGRNEYYEKLEELHSTPLSIKNYDI